MHIYGNLPLCHSFQTQSITSRHSLTVLSTFSFWICQKEQIMNLWCFLQKKIAVCQLKQLHIANSNNNSISFTHKQINKIVCCRTEKMNSSWTCCLNMERCNARAHLRPESLLQATGRWPRSALHLEHKWFIQSGAGCPYPQHWLWRI